MYLQDFQQLILISFVTTAEKVLQLIKLQNTNVLKINVSVAVNIMIVKKTGICGILV